MEKVAIPTDLLPRIAGGDEKAFEELYRLTYRAVFSFLLSLTANQDDARDLMQETYMKVFVSARLYQERGNPLAWIMTIGKNLFLMGSRKRKSGIVYLDDCTEWATDIPFDSVSDLETRDILRRLFAELSAEERSVVTLHDISGFTFREIAELLDIPHGTVMSKYHRAFSKLRERSKQTETKGINRERGQNDR